MMRRHTSIRFAAPSRVAVAIAGVALALFVVVVAPVRPAAATPPGQIVTVRASSSSATTAVAQAWSRNADGSYRVVHGPYGVHVGRNGVGPTHEGAGRTPSGVFTLTQAFGNQASNGTRLSYFRAGRDDWWDENPASAAYNRHVVRATSPGGASENLYTTGAAYAHAVVIDYNMNPVVKGAGSGFFLHVSLGRPTAGCVSFKSSSLDTVMRWLDPTQHPVVSIGVGAAATAPVDRANAAAKHNPFGWVDAVTPRTTSTGSRVVRVRGWAVDPDNRSWRLTIGVHVDGAPDGYSYTGVSRPDVATKKHAGPDQGYDFERPITKGVHTVCIYAGNRSIGTVNPELGCKTITVA